MTMASLRPSSPVTLSLAQLIGYALAIGGVGFSVGAVYPKVLALESAVSILQSQMTDTARALERVSVIVERMDREPRR